MKKSPRSNAQKTCFIQFYDLPVLPDDVQLSTDISDLVLVLSKLSIDINSVFASIYFAFTQLSKFSQSLEDQLPCLKDVWTSPYVQQEAEFRKLQWVLHTHIPTLILPVWSFVHSTDYCHYFCLVLLATIITASCFCFWIVS